MDARTDDEPWADETPEGWDDEGYDAEGGYDDEPVLYGAGAGDTDPRRAQAVVAIVLAGVFFMFSLVVLASFNVQSGPLADLFDFWGLATWAWLFFGVLMLFAIWLGVLLFTAPARQDEDWYAGEDADAGPPVAAYADDPGEADTITLRCPQCMNIFSLQDPWTRPFYHVCPHCDARGVYTGSQDPPEVKAQLERAGQQYSMGA